MEYKDYYKILGVSKDASQDDIKRSYRKYAKKYHPDLNPGDREAERRFKEINEAYQVLGDEEKRKKYDAFGSGANFQNGTHFDPSQYGQYRRTYSTGSTDFSDFFNMFFGGDEMDLGDIFTGFTSGQSHIQRQDIEVDMKVDIFLAQRGGERTLSLRGPDGSIRRLKVKIPAGILDGEKIRLKGQGESGGDLIITMRIQESQGFSLDGHDIEKEVFIQPWEAALGTKLTVETLDGQRIAVNISPSTSSGQKLRIPGKGYRDRKGKKGNMYIKTRIVLPKHLTSEEKALYKKLKDLSS